MDTAKRRQNLSKSIPPDAAIDHVAHERLFEKLNRASLAKCVIIHAPEGYGKTALLGTWYHKVLCRDEVKRGVWFRVDKCDTNPFVFWPNILNAMASLWPSLKEIIDEVMLHLQEGQDSEFFIRLSNHIIENSRLEDGYTLILDDFESFLDSDAERQFIDFVETLPFNIHVIISTRVYRDNLFSIKDSHNFLTVIGSDDLVLTESEIATWLSRRIEQPLSFKEIATIHARTKGWSLAVRAVIDELTGCDNIEKTVERLSGTNHFLGNFVFSHSLQELPAQVSSFLYETAFLDRFCASLCDNVVGRQDSAEIIRYLETSGLFTNALDKDKVWYSYHPLFAHWLQRQSFNFKSDLLRTLNSRAAQWYRSHNLYLPSTRHVIAAIEDDFILHLAHMTISDAAFSSGKLLPWLFSLPEQSFERNAEFCALATWAYVFSGRPRDALYWSRKAQELLLAAAPNTAPDIFPLRVVAAKCLSLNGDTDQGISLSESLLTEMDCHADDLFRMVLYQNLGEAHEMCGEIALAMKYYQKANTLARMFRFEFLIGFTRYQIVCLYIRQGNISNAEELCRTALKQCPQDLTVYGALYAALAHIKLIQNDLGEVDVYLRRANKRASTIRNIDIYLDISVAKSQYLFARHEYSEAQLVLATAVRAVRSSVDVPPRGVTFTVFAQQALLYLRLGDVESASEIIQDYLHLELPLTKYDLLYLQLIKARIALAQGCSEQEMEQLAASLDAVAAQAKDCSMGLMLVEVYLLATLFHHQIGDGDAMLNSLKRALNLARFGCLIRPFINEGNTMRLLLVDACSSNRIGFEAERFAKRLIRAFGDEQLDEAAGQELVGAGGMQMRVSDNAVIFDRWGLTSSEQRVVHFLVKGMNRKEIAAASCTSQNTVKTHISHIYEKVGVHSVSDLFQILMESGMR